MLALGALVGTTAPGTAFAENGVTPTPKCDASAMVNVRYAGTSRRLYLEKLDGKRGGCGTLTSIYTAIRKTTNALIPIFPSNSSESPTITGTWLLSQDLYVLDGITLNVSCTVRKIPNKCTRTADNRKLFFLYQIERDASVGPRAYILPPSAGLFT